MKTFRKLCESLVKQEAVREVPVEPEMLHDAIHETNSIEEAFEKYTQSSVFEEFSFPYATTSLYPIPMTYGASDAGVRGIVDKIDAPLRSKVLALGKQKKPNQSVVYSDAKKEAIIIDKNDLGDFVKKGYIVIYEEANTAPVPTDGQFKNTSGSFNKVAGYDLPLFAKNKKELKKYKGKVFEVPSHIFRRLKEGHPRYSRWADYIHEEDDANFIDTIKNYSMRNPRSPVVIRNEENGEMAIMRRRTNDARLKHNRSK
jgi:hypothetical protein